MSEASCEKAAELRRISKRYPNVVANDCVDFEVCVGEIHCLLGENGAGKTTLVNVLYGLVEPDEGEVIVWGERPKRWSPREALRRGIAMVAQHFTLIPKLTVLENVLLAAAGASIDLNAHEAERRLRELSSRYGLKVDPRAYAWQLSTGEKQRAELLRALALGATLLILDEPTSALSPIEVRSLFEVLRRLRSEGKAVIFITHKLWEALEICDRITVMRRGKRVGTLKRAEVDRSTLIAMMFGESVEQLESRVDKMVGEPVLVVRDLWVKSDRGRWAVKGASFDVRRGEIFGVAGVAGNGQLELVEALVGLRRIERGSVILAGEDVSRASVKKRIELGLAYIPESRFGRGVARGLSVAENLLLKHHASLALRRGPLLKPSEALRLAQSIASSYKIEAPDLRAPVDTLSGGNIQRLIVARELSLRPRVLVAHNPTAGLDAKTTAEIRSEILELARAGTAVLLVSEELEELMEVSDKLAVMFDGTILGPFDRGISVEELGYMMIAGEGVSF
ncbi:MAG: ABC transporter ATP-binding protein, partial [Fervidicoccaceae archaeon]